MAGYERTFSITIAFSDTLMSHQKPPQISPLTHL